MSNDLTIQGEVVVNADKATQAFDHVADKAQAMAADVAGSAGKAGQAVEGIGASAEKGAEGFTRAESRIEASIKRATRELELLGKTASQRIEFNIGERGLDAAKFEPMLQSLRDVEAKARQAHAVATGSLDGIGMSAKATAAAMRGVPAQFTDIITSLQGGQKPLTVLLQQGGQLKDMFGGAGNAARALGTYVVGLINPFSLLAAGVGAVGLAYYSGSQEAAAFTKAIVLSGNAAGVTASQLGTMTANVAKITGGTQGAAAEALAAIVQSGAVGAQNLEKFAAAAVVYSKATGQAIGDTVKQFDELRKSPVDASLKLNDSTNFLTASLYRQIKALEDQGRATEAAALAQTAYADSISSRASEIINNLGLFERGWNAVANAGKKALDDIKGIGRTDPLAQQIALKQQQVDAYANAKYTGSSGLTDQGRAIKLAQMQAELDNLKEVERLSGKVAAKRAEEAASVKSLAAWEKEGEQFKSKAVKLEEALVKARIEGQDLINKGLITERELAERIAGIRRQYTDTTGQSEVAGIRAKIIEQTKYLELLKASGSSVDKRTDGEKLVTKIQEELKTSINGVARAEKERALVAAQALATVDRQVLAEQKYHDALKASADLLNQQIDAVRKQATSIQDQALGQEAANTNFGKSKTAIEQSTLALLKQQAAEADSSSQFAPAYVAAMQAKVEAQERFVKALQETEYRQAKLRLDEAATAGREETKSLELQLSLMGETQQTRERIIGQRQVEIRLAKELAAIEKLNLGTGPEADTKRAVLRAEATANAVVEANNVATKSVVDEWQRASDSINQSLTDALLRGFESGKGFAENLRDTVVNLFKTMVLRRFISDNIAPVAGSVANIFGLGGGSTAAGALNTLGGASSIFGGAGGSVLGGLGFFGSGLKAGLGAVFGEAGTLGGLSAGATSLGAGNVLGGLGTLAGTALPWLAGASLLKSLTDYKVESRGSGLTATLGGATGLPSGSVGMFNEFQQTGGLGGGGTTINRDWSVADQGVADYISDTVRSATASVKAYATALGLAPDAVDNFTKQIEVSISGLNADQQKDAINKAIGSFVDEMVGAAYGGVLTGIAKPGETASQTMERLAEDLTGVNAVFGTLNKTLLPVGVNGASTAAALAEVFGGLDKFQAAVGSYADAFYTDAEKSARGVANLTDSFAKLGIAVPASKEEFRALVESIDITTQSGRMLYASVINLAPAFDQASSSARAAANNMLSAIQNWGSSSDVRNFQAQQLQQSLASGGLNLSIGEILGATQASALAFYQSLDPNSRQAQVLLSNQQAIFDFVGGVRQAAAGGFGSGVGSSGGGGGGGGAGDTAASSIASAWQQITDAIWNEVKRIRGLIEGSGQDAYAAAQARFGVATAQARAGDQEAAKALPELSQHLLTLAETNAQTLLELRLVQSQTAASLTTTGSILSTRFGLAVPTVAVSPTSAPQASSPVATAVYNPALGSTGANGDADTVAVLRMVVDRLDLLEANTRAGATHGATTARILTRVTPDGDAIETREATT